MEITLTEPQEKLLNKLAPMYGESPSDVVQFILIDWIHHNAEGILNVSDICHYLEEEEHGPGGCSCH